jgi:hypothetical protein
LGSFACFSSSIAGFFAFPFSFFPNIYVEFCNGHAKGKAGVFFHLIDIIRFLVLAKDRIFAGSSKGKGLCQGFDNWKGTRLDGRDKRRRQGEKRGREMGRGGKEYPLSPGTVIST